MSNRPRVDGPERVFHLTARVNWQAWHLHDDQTRTALARIASDAAAQYGVRIFAYAFMANHFHFVVQSPPAPLFQHLTSRRTRCRHRKPWPIGHQNASVISQFMRAIRSAISRIRQEQLELSGRFWEGRYDARTVLTPASLVTRIAYDHRNPVVQGIVDLSDQYRWSSARAWLTGRSRDSDIPIEMSAAPFGTDPALLRRVVVELQLDERLDRADDLRRSLQNPQCSAGEIEYALEQAGIVIPL